jgi:Sugar (and other) transporter
LFGKKKGFLKSRIKIHMNFRIRGLLGSTLRLFFGVGVLLAYIFGAVLPYHLVPLASAPFSMVFLYGFWNVPETPLFLLKKQKHEVR